MIVPAFLDKARAMAGKSPAKNYQVGAVIARGTFIIACGRNRNFGAEPRPKGFRSLHAELDCIRKSRADLSGATIYVVVLTQRRNDGISRPCELCLPILRELGIERIVYSNRGVLTEEKL